VVEAGRRGTHDWRRAIARAPDPERAAQLAESLLAALAPEQRSELDAHGPDRVGSLLLAVCGVAPFFAPRLRRSPEMLLALIEEDLDRPVEREQLAARLERHLRGDPAPTEAALRRFKYYELARITWRDVHEGALPLERSAETLSELTNLADLLLQRSFETAEARIESRFGPPEWPATGGGNERLAFCVIGLGKLGGGELNFSSDVDLIYVSQAPARELLPDPERPSPADYFTRLAQAFGTILSAHTHEGFLYRVDLDLRPSGAQGTLVLTDEALQSYYELWADTWEKATFTKARPVAGALDFGWRTIRAVHPLIYRSARDYAAVRGIRELKDKFERAHGAGEGSFDVKLDRGGIRDVEFVAQALQLLHGARIPQLRTRSTLEAIQQLAQVGLLEPARAESLARDYLGLRRLENRLQMEAERQVHELPRDPDARGRLARALGFSGASASSEFEAELDASRGRVHAVYQSVLAGSGADGGREAVLDVFLRANPQWGAFPPSRRMLEELASQFAQAIDATGERERALNNLVRFAEGIGRRRFYYELLLDRPELVRRLTGLFAASKYLSGYVASHPRLIEPLFDDPELLLLDRPALEAQLAAATAAPEDGERDPADVHLDGLRLFHHCQTVNVGLLDLAEMVALEEAQGALSDVAELCIEDALAFAREQVAPRPRGQLRFVVVAMGKLASRELTYGSDLDLIFVFDARSPDGQVDLAAQQYFVKLTQRFISALQTPTSEGICYEIDARLRPSGNQGSLVTSLDAFRRYHDSAAQTWERQALLRARAVAGDASLAAEFDALRTEILRRPVPEDAIREIDRMRGRMEAELARETPQRRNFKTGRGGVLDVESIVQALQLAHGAEHPELCEVVSTETQLARLARLGLLEEKSAALLREGWRFLQRLSSRLRIVDNRSISDLDQERGDLEGLARRLGYTSTGREGEARRALLADYERHTEAIRVEYRRLFQNV
jgi:glutamate-ammonia-ligase adenylyltransferase